MSNKTINFKKLEKDFEELKKDIGSPDISDFKHLKKIERWGRSSAIIGYLTAWIFPFNIISAFLLSIGNISRWANVAHPVLHGGYDKIVGVPLRYTKKGFAKYGRRYLDWLDWIEPSSWDYEHNKMHHYHLGELTDPDNVQENMYWLHDMKIPMFLKYMIVIFFSFIWKFAYYAPNTLKLLINQENKRKGKVENDSFLSKEAFSPFTERGWRLWSEAYLPYLIFNFGIKPLPFLLISPQAYMNGLITFVIAEAITNFHSFLVIVPNHSARDIYSFNSPHRSQGEFYYRQVMGSVNYKTGSDFNDFLHGWLNYQIEHHLFPNLPLSQYQKLQPKIKEFCENNNIPYREDSVWKRLKMSLDLMVGKDKLLIWEDYIVENNITVIDGKENTKITTEEEVLKRQVS